MSQSTTGTELIFSQMSVEEQISFLNSILKNSTDYYSIIATDLNNMIVAWNEGASLEFGYLPPEIIGHSLFTLYDSHNSKFEKIKMILSEVHRTGIWFAELTCIRKNGNHFTAFVTIILRKNLDEKPVGFTIISRALSESQQILHNLKETEELLQSKNKALQVITEQAKSANRLKTEFLANVSHELRTPLNAIIGFAELMYLGKVGPVSPEHKEYLSDILSSSRQLLLLINDILDLAKVESGKMEFHPQLIFISDLIDDTREIFHKLIIKKNMRLKIQIDPQLCDIFIDPAKFKQVLYNYVSNALKFSPVGTEVSISVHASENNTFRLEVKDAGIGIRKEDLGRLFIPFQQLDAGSTKKYQGTGLGLSLTKNIVEAQGGQVGVESTLGKGSTFYAILPCFPQYDYQLPLEYTPSEKIPKILLIEENSQDRDILAQALSNVGYAIETAAKLSEAPVHSIAQFDAIVLDLFLPDFSSWKILHTLRTNRPPQEAPTLVVTVVSEKATGLGFKIHDFLIKPVIPKDLLAALEWAGASPQSGKTVLIIDDDKKAAKFAEQLLKKSGYRVICKKDMKSALEAAELEHPDVLLLDPFLSQLEGFELLRRFRESEKGLYTPVIIWTIKDLTAEERMRLKTQAQRRVVLEGENITTNLVTELKQHLPPPR